MNILVTGGAGYIGSVMTRQLLDEGHKVVVLDDLSSGHANAVDLRSTFVNQNLDDTKKLEELFKKERIEGIIHFAGVISMAESMRDPGLYFQINTISTLHLLEFMRKYNVNSMIFSSTAGVYGEPNHIPIEETHSQIPTNPYGESKSMIEKMLYWYNQIYGINYIALRYFNAAGASIDRLLGERHKDETHLIPLAIRAIMEDKPFILYGEDYETKDGTCIRDYVHVEDLCKAHLLAIESLKKNQASTAYNVGTGNGFSNRDVLKMVEKVSGKKLVVTVKSRRPGDARELVADPSKIKTELGWEPRYSDLQTIVQTAWDFHKKNGFGN
jgi:UDP-glucose 4-epimerase